VGVAALALAGSASAATSGWKMAAKASDSSPYFASASLTKQVTNARAARVGVGSTQRVTVRGTVFCTSGFNFEDRTFAVVVPGGQRVVTRPIPVPLKRANCTYILDATLANGGAILIGLMVLV
jgi:hypothetical protein